MAYTKSSDYKNKDDTIKQHTQVYTAEDKVAFADRDRRITKLACLKCAVDVCIAINSEDKTARAVEIANEFVDWAYDVPNKLTDKVNVLDKSLQDLVALSFPNKVEPNDVEKKIIYQVAHTLNDRLVEKGDKRVVDVKCLVNWVWDTFKKYPVNVKSIDKILATPGVESCLTENNFVKDLT